MKNFHDFEAEFTANNPDARYHDAVEAYNGIYFKENAKVGDGATVHLWSDAEAYTIIKRTANTLTLRRCKATLKPEFKPEFIIGGFCAHCTNQHEQDYTYEEDENGYVTTAHWSNKLKRFRADGMTVTPNRREYYDYNF